MNRTGTEERTPTILIAIDSSTPRSVVYRRVSELIHSRWLNTSHKVAVFNPDASSQHEYMQSFNATPVNGKAIRDLVKNSHIVRAVVFEPVPRTWNTNLSKYLADRGVFTKTYQIQNLETQYD